MRKVPARATNATQTSTSSRVLRSHTRQAAAEARANNPSNKKRRSRTDPWAKKRRQNPDPKPRKPPPTHFTCRICIEEQLVDEFPKWLPPKRGRWEATDIPFACVGHLARNPSKRNIDPVCKTCIGNYLAAKMDTLGVRAISTGCLEPGCSEPWPHDFIIRYMPAGAPLEKFNLQMLEVWMENTNPKLFTCSSSTCNAIGLPDTTAAGYPQVACHECSFRSCAQCGVDWHKGVTCAEYAAKHVEEKMSEEEKDTLKFMQGMDGRRCPNCQLVIEKDGGCDSMFCVGCHKYFNWASAASALVGAKRAEAPYIRDMPYWQNVGFVTCEMDGLLGLGSGTDANAAASESEDGASAEGTRLQPTWV